MISRFTLRMAMVLFLTVIIFGVTENGHAKTDGSPSGNTGSPDDGQTCAHSGCHSGTALAREGLITTDVPASGYLEGQSYIVTVTVTEPGITKFGFQASPQDDAGNALGTMTVVDAGATKLTGGGKYITHTSAGTAGSGTRSWTFSWTPDGTTGDVTFYSAVNASNAGGNASGDKIYFGSLTIIEDPANNPVSVQDSQILQSTISQQGNNLYVEVSAVEAGELLLIISDLNGRTTGSYIYPSSTGVYRISADTYTPGTYIATFFVNGKRTAQKFMVL